MKLAFAGLLLWHALVCAMKGHAASEGKPMSAITILMLAQISIIGYLMHHWICDLPYVEAEATPA